MYEEMLIPKVTLEARRLGKHDGDYLCSVDPIDAILDIDKRLGAIEAVFVAIRDGQMHEMDDLLMAIEIKLMPQKSAEQLRSESEPVSRPGE